MSFKSFYRGIFGGLSDLIYPDLCPVCGVPLIENEKWFCTSCAYRLPKVPNAPFAENEACQTLAGKVRFCKAAAYLRYVKDSPVQILFEQFKYAGKYGLAEQLGVMAGTELAEQGFFDGIDIILPVPLHPDRFAARGYNQSYWISRGLTKACGLPIDTVSVERSSMTATQTKKSSWDRQHNVKEAFSLADDSLYGKHVLIVDDVLTTGATLSSCAHAVWSAKPASVSFFALALA